MRLPQRQELLAAQFGRQAGIAGEDHAQERARVEVHGGEQEIAEIAAVRQRHSTRPLYSYRRLGARR
jgi:hypothetical protein